LFIYLVVRSDLRKDITIKSFSYNVKLHTAKINKSHWWTLLVWNILTHKIKQHYLIVYLCIKH